MVHAGQKLLLDWVAGCVSDDGVNSALRAESSALVIAPLLHVGRRERGQAVEAAALGARLALGSVLDRSLVSGDVSVLFHRRSVTVSWVGQKANRNAQRDSRWATSGLQTQPAGKSLATSSSSSGSARESNYRSPF
jgi:hypothetical protein